MTKPMTPGEYTQKHRDAYDRHAKLAEELEHIGWYGKPARRPPSELYRTNFAKIEWREKEKNCPH